MRNGQLAGDRAFFLEGGDEAVFVGICSIDSADELAVFLLDDDHVGNERPSKGDALFRNWRFRQ